MQQGRLPLQTRCGVKAIFSYFFREKSTHIKPLIEGVILFDSDSLE